MIASGCSFFQRLAQQRHIVGHVRAPVADQLHLAGARQPVVDDAIGQRGRFLFPPIVVLREPRLERVADILDQAAEPAAPIEIAISGDQAADILLGLGLECGWGRNRLACRLRAVIGRGRSLARWFGLRSATGPVPRRSPIVDIVVFGRLPNRHVAIPDRRLMTHRRPLYGLTALAKRLCRAIGGSICTAFSIIHRYCISGLRESIYLTRHEGLVTAMTTGQKAKRPKGNGPKPS